MLGKPLVGKPIATEHIKALPITSRLGCGSFIPIPTSLTRGSRINAATVWEMKVATTRIKAAKTKRTPYKLSPATPLVIERAIVCRSPEEVTAFPRQSPPDARMMMVQRKLLKSSFVRMPVPKNSTRGRMAITPMSPNVLSSWWLTHHRHIVPIVTMVMNHWMPVNLSFTGRMGMIVVPRLGLKVIRRRTQMARIERMQIGNAIKNHIPQLMAGSMFCNAMIF